MKKSSKFQLVQRITIKSPLIPRSCEKIGLVLFRVIPAKAGIQCFHWLQILWTPVFTGETNRIDFFTPSPFSKGETPSPPFGVFSLRPRSPNLYTDAHYCLFAVGLLAERYPNIAFRIARKYLKKWN